MSKSAFSHQPVLLQEVASLFQEVDMHCFFDGTIGSGGHAYLVLSQHPSAFLIGVDKDKDMIEEARKRLKPFQSRSAIINGNYADIEKILHDRQISFLDGFLLDLGVSSRQLDDPQRGFSYQEDAPLDMRFDRRQNLTACDVINGEPKEKLEDIMARYGEERDAKRIAKMIVRIRRKEPLKTTRQLDELVRRAKGRRSYRRNPSARVFQAFRIFVNRELENVIRVLPAALKCLRPGGRMAVISFHSLEDRIVKKFFRDAAKKCRCPEGFPVCRCGGDPLVKILTPRPIVPGAQEVEKNPRSRSAKLRAAEKTGGEN